MVEALTFSDLLSKERFLELFDNYKALNNFQILIDKSSLVSNDSEELKLFNRYLLHNLTSLSDSYLLDYKNELENLNIQGGNIEFFHKYKGAELIEYYDLCDKHEYFSKELKDKIKSELDVCMDGKRGLKEEGDMLRGDKINFKFTNQIDVIVLLYLLHQNGVIKWTSSMPELNETIRNNCRYFNEEQNCYQEMRNKVTKLYDIKNGHETIEKSLKRLKKIFQKEDFFELKELR